MSFMEPNFQVKEQTQPVRCEVCHKSDLFDPFTASCLRCQALILTQALPEEEAERYRRRQEANLTMTRDTSVPTGDLFRVIPEAVKLCRRNFWLFFSIFAIATLPATLLGLVPAVMAKMSGSNPFFFIAITLFCVLLSVILYPIG